jgi:hypothetical protein
MRNTLHLNPDSVNLSQSLRPYEHPIAMSEEWRPVLDGYYEVSSLGNVRRAKAGVNPWATSIGKILRPQLAGRKGKKYLRVGVHIDGRVSYVYVHQLIALAFFGPRPHGHDINHKDLDRLNNCASNLEYITRSENHKHAMRVHGHWGPSKLSTSQIAEAKRLHDDGQSLRQIARKFNVVMSAIQYRLARYAE